MSSDLSKKAKAKEGWNPKPTPSPFGKIPPPPHVPTFPPQSISDRAVDEGWEDLPDTLPGPCVEEAEGSSNTEVPTTADVPRPSYKAVTRPSSPRAIRLDDLREALEELRLRHDEVFPPSSEGLPKK